MNQEEERHSGKKWRRGAETPGEFLKRVHRSKLDKFHALFENALNDAAKTDGEDGVIVVDVNSLIPFYSSDLNKLNALLNGVLLDKEYKEFDVTKHQVNYDSGDIRQEKWSHHALRFSLRSEGPRN